AHSFWGIVLEGSVASPSEPMSRMRAAHVHARTSRHDILIIAGTRPECIKLAPVVRELASRRAFGGIVANSGQHADAVRRTFAEFRVTCDVELPPLPPSHNLTLASHYLVDQLKA